MTAAPQKLKRSPSTPISRCAVCCLTAIEEEAERTARRHLAELLKTLRQS